MKMYNGKIPSKGTVARKKSSGKGLRVHDYAIFL